MESEKHHPNAGTRAVALITAVGLSAGAEGEEGLLNALASFHANAERLADLDLTGWEPVLVYLPGERARDV